jgi:hypothetical protein
MWYVGTYSSGSFHQVCHSERERRILRDGQRDSSLTLRMTSEALRMTRGCSTHSILQSLRLEGDRKGRTYIPSLTLPTQFYNRYAITALLRRGRGKGFHKWVVR